MSNLVIVAIPTEDDLVWKISSEKVPHITLLFLGEVAKVQNIDQILNFLDHAAKTTLQSFYLDVDHRGVLGADEADVLFFRDNWELPRLKEFRASLLKNDAIFKAHISEDQFPEWVPHLTLGYPATPAKKLDNDRQFYGVHFDRVALWVDDYAGPEFRLNSYDSMPEVSMSTAVDDILSHHGVKGMRWGKRLSTAISNQKARVEAQNVVRIAPKDVKITTTLKKGKTKVQTKGGENQPVHKDALDTKIAIQKGKKSGIDSLSNKELKALSTRLNLEKQVKDLGDDPFTNNGKKIIAALLEANTSRR